MRVAIVGAGIVGANAAWRLAERGHEVALFEQYEPANLKGSSHGRSRIVRKAYPDPFYTELMLEGFPLWYELEQRSGKRLLNLCGLLQFGDPASPGMITLVQGLAMLDVDHRLYNRHDVGSVFPEFILESGEIGVFTPEAGWVSAVEAVKASVAVAIASGVRLEQRPIVSLDELSAYDQVAICTGAWVKRFVPLDVKVTEQTFAYLPAVRTGPVWIEDGEHGIYGFPTEPGGDGVKAGVHSDGPEIDPDQPRPGPTPEAISLLKDFAYRRFVSTGELTEPTTCLYTRTANDDFRFGRLNDRTVYASPCSGHGFKFGPWSGKFVADLVEGRQQPDRYPRFVYSER